MHRITVILRMGTVLLILALTVQAQTFLNPNAPVTARVEDLLGRMSLAEKVGQMTQADRGALTSEADIAGFFLGSVLSGGGSVPTDNSPKGWADMYDRFQTQALSTRLAIPIIYGVDAVHGHNNVKGAVIFPHNIGLGATRNPDLVRQAAEITALEVAGTGINWTFAPCLALPWDERWGRTYEGFSEETALTTLLGAAAVKGFQGDSLGQADHILACAKHYIGDGGTTGGDDQGNTEINEATLRAKLLPAYISAIAAGVGSIMPSYSSWNGAKMHGHAYLLTTVLKGELAFKGFVVSDWAGIDQLPGDYHSDVVQSINAGIDMIMVPTDYRGFIKELTAAINAGEIAMTRIDDAVRRILTIKFKMGLFEHAYTDRALTAEVGNAAHRAVARACVRESLVLLAKKDGILPLSRSLKRIHVCGNGADNIGNQCGGWTITWQGSSGAITTGTTILQALKAEAPGINFTYSLDGSGAAGADLAIAVIGETPYAESQGDKTDLHLASQVVEPIRTLKKTGLKTAAILLSGRPIIIDSILPYTDALIAAWLPGTEAGGIADVLFGGYPFSGTLPHSWPRAMADIPINWGDDPYRPLYPFGYGITNLADSEPGSAPVVHAASVNADGDTVLIHFNKAMADPSAGTPADWTVLVNWGIDEVTGISQQTNDLTTIRLALTRPIVKRDVVIVQYKGTAVHSADSGLLASFENQPVYNLRNDIAGKLPVPGRVEAEDFSQMQGIQLETTSDVGGGENVGYIDTGDYMVYQVDVAATGVYQLDFRIAAESKSGQLKVIDTSTLLATVDLPITGGWQVWQTVSSTATLSKGAHVLRVQATRGGFNLNYIDFTSVTGITANEIIAPSDFHVTANYPNPFNASTTILCSIPESNRNEHLKLTITDILGREVHKMEVQAIGVQHRFQWDGYDAAGRTLASGIYFYTVQFGKKKETLKMMLLR